MTLLYSRNMHFILTTDWEEGIADLAQRLQQELAAHKRVLWLVSGGSNIAASVQAMAQIPSELTDKLSVMLGDERYGAAGHANSNWAQLLQSGFNADKATVYPILQPDLTFEGTVERFNLLANQAFAENDIVIAQLGIGPDGHIAGILPESPAAQEQTALVTGYDGGQFQRVTLTFPALLKVHVSYTFAYGEAKKDALSSLQAGSLELTVQPAQVLREIPEAYIYNDQLGDAS